MPPGPVNHSRDRKEENDLGMDFNGGIIRSMECPGQEVLRSGMDVASGKKTDKLGVSPNGPVSMHKAEFPIRENLPPFPIAFFGTSPLFDSPGIGFCPGGYPWCPIPNTSGSSGDAESLQCAPRHPSVDSFRTRQMTTSCQDPWMSCRLVKSPILVGQGSIGGSCGSILALGVGYPNAAAARGLLCARHDLPASSTENLWPRGGFHEPFGSDSVLHVRFL